MSAVVVGIPILKDARRFHVQKGRRWTIFEHILLEALARKDWSVLKLTEASNLPRRVVIEILIRLMRAGWVQLTSTSDGIVFAATPRGRVYSTQPDLPPVTRPDARFIGYTFELVAGSVFRLRDLAPATEDQWRKRTLGRPAALIREADEASRRFPDAKLLADVLLEPDEELIRVDVQDWRPRKRIGVVVVRGQDIEGLGARPSEELRGAIFAAAKRAEVVGGAGSPISVPAPQISWSQARKARPFQYRADDVILGGEAHRIAVEQILKRARHRIVVHSTFIAPNRERELVELFRMPMQRGAHIDILWGQDSERDGVNGTRKAAQALHTEVERAGLADRLRVHMNSTRSHAKLLLADAGDEVSYVAMVGSCNWLSSGYSSFDASMRLRNSGVVADIAFELAELSRPRDGQVPDLCSELIRLGQMLERDKDGPSQSTAQLIIGPRHGQIVLDARDEAKQRILILSHRLGPKAKPILKPLLAAAKDKQVQCNVYYGRLTGKVSVEAAADQVEAGRKDGFEMVAVQKPRLHAKVLAWDENDVVITSQNWLSADPSELDPRQEIGIHIRASGVARTLEERFRVAREFA